MQLPNPGGTKVKRYRLVLLSAVLSVGLVAGACGRSGSDSANPTTDPAKAADAACSKTTLEATDVGVSADTITVEVMADTGSALAPGLFQGNVDAMNAYAKYVNANGGIGCRQLKVVAWDSKLDPTESKNGIINACQNAVAMVGGNALFNPDTSVLNTCVDKAGVATGLPDYAALANDINEQCAPTAFIIQAVAETCKTLTGSRELKAFTGTFDFFKTLAPSLNALWLVPGDLPTTIQSSTYQIAAAKQSGINVTDAMKVSGRTEQSGFTTYVQAIKAGNDNMVYNGSNDVVMTKMRKEAAAQGLDSVKVWGCSLACYTDNFKAQGTAVEGTYVWMQFLPFEEASSNAADQAYVTASNGKPDSFGAQAWQAGMAFKATIDSIVAAKGANGITRAAILETMKTLQFDADGWIGARTGPKVFSDCMVMMQMQGGKFVRVAPAKVGTLDCNPKYVSTVTLDPQEAAKSVN
jgi:ABC-type branched-subunit amino acid transport system substrate-binding protein